MSYTAAISNKHYLTFYGLGVPVLLVSMLAMMVLPMPPVMLDLFFTFNIALSLVVLLVGSGALKNVAARRPQR